MNACAVAVGSLCSILYYQSARCIAHYWSNTLPAVLWCKIGARLNWDLVSLGSALCRHGICPRQFLHCILLKVSVLIQNYSHTIWFSFFIGCLSRHNPSLQSDLLEGISWYPSSYPLSPMLKLIYWHTQISPQMYENIIHWKLLKVTMRFSLERKTGLLLKIRFHLTPTWSKMLCQYRWHIGVTSCLLAAVILSAYLWKFIRTKLFTSSWWLITCSLILIIFERQKETRNYWRFLHYIKKHTCINDFVYEVMLECWNHYSHLIVLFLFRPNVFKSNVDIDRDFAFIVIILFYFKIFYYNILII